MEKERQLEDSALGHILLAEATDEHLIEEFSTRDLAEIYGLSLARAVINGEMKLSDLKAFAERMNDLDREAIEKSDGDIENLADQDYFEAIARRIGHQMAHYAYSLVKTGSHRNTARATLM